PPPVRKPSAGNVDSAPALSLEPIAIVGMACRFPGEAEDLEGFWRMLSAGRDAIVEPPRDRWDPSDPYAASLRPAGFVRDVAGFDPLRFGISPREAPNLDPQQRMMLEVCWHALEDARMNPRAIPPGCGVFVGAGPVDYGRL